MENDYLWDKTGADAEIEELEKTLQVFRSQELNAPLLPKKITVTKPKFSLVSLRFAFSFAACLAVLLGGFFVVQKSVSPNESAAKIIEQNTERIVVEPFEIKPEIVKEISPRPLKVAVQPTQIDYREKVAKSTIRPAKPKNIKSKVVLTEEEQYAYDQLMLALSITGSKLKQVRDKANGGEEIAASTKDLK